MHRKVTQKNNARRITKKLHHYLYTLTPVLDMPDYKRYTNKTYRLQGRQNASKSKLPTVPGIHQKKVPTKKIPNKKVNMRNTGSKEQKKGGRRPSVI